MSIDHSQPDALSAFSFRFLKPSHRTLPEQILGFFILLLISFGFQLLNRWIVPFSFHTEWYRNLIQAPWAIPTWPSTPFWSSYHFLLAFAVWTLWRRFSLRSLKLELSVFLAQFILQSLWALSFFIFQETLLALVGLLLLLCSTLLSALLFWKKERLSGQLLIAPFLWTFYIMGINMAICILNP